MQTRFVAYDRLGARRGVIPNPLSAVPVIPVNDMSTLTLTYDRMSPNHEFLDNDPEIALERLNGSTWVEIPNARFRCLTIDFDHLDEIPTRSYQFIHVGENLSGVTVYAPNGRPTNDQGAVQWKLATAGQVVSNVWSDAVARGWGGFSINFTSTTDSSGAPWATKFSMAFDLDTTLSSILDRLVQLGLCDYEWNGRQLNLYNPATTLARDLTLGTTPVRFAGSGNPAGIDSAPEQTDSSNLATHIVVLGENGLRWVFPTGWVAPEGRRELVVSYSGVDDEGTARILADPLIVKGTNVLMNTTRQFHLTPSTKNVPWVDYRPGDWAWVLRGTTFERMRIRLISLQVDGNGTQGFVSFGDKIDDILETMYEKIQRVTGSIANEGTGTVAKPKPTKPTVPTNVQATADTYIDKNGVTQGVVTVGWVHDGLDVYGKTVSMRSFLVEYREQTKNVWTQFMSVPATETGGTQSPLRVYDKDNNPLYYWFRVSAISNDSLNSGASESFGLQMVEDTVAPPTPDFTADDVTTKYATATVTWNGKGRSDTGVLVDMAPDLDYVAVYQFTDAAGSGKTRVGTLQAAYELFSTADVTPDVTVWFGLSAVDTTGNESPMSPLFSVTPQSLVKSVDISAALTAIDTKAGNAQTAALAATNAASDAQADADALKLSTDSAIAQIIARGQSLVRNGDFEAGEDGWSLVADSTIGSANPRSGTKAMQINAPAANRYPLSELVPTSTGRIYYVEFWVRRGGNNIVDTGSVAPIMQIKTAAGGNANVVFTPYTAASVLTPGAYVKVSGIATITTADAVSVRFGPWVSGPTTNVFNIDDILVIDVTEAQGALTAAQDAQTKADQAFTNAGAALTAAGNAQTSANGKNNTYYLPALPGGSGFVTGDTTFIRSAVGQPITAQYQWDGATWQPVTISHQVIASVDLGKAVIGELDGIYIKARSASINTLLIGSLDNVIPDPTFTNTAIDWGAAGGLYSFPQTEGYNGGPALKVAAASGQNGRYSQKVPVTGGSSYRVTVWVKSDVAIPAGALGVYAQSTQAGGAVVTGNQLKQADGVTAGNDPIAANTWAQLTLVAQFDPAAVYGAFGFYKQTTFTTGTVWWSLASATRMGDGNLTVDGSITANALATNSVTAVKIAGGTITGDKLDAGSVKTVILTADAITTTMLSATAITSKHTITGAKFQTTATANRGIEITTAGFNAYSNTGVNTVSISAVDGSAMFTGRLRTAANGPGAVMLPAADSYNGKQSGFFISAGAAIEASQAAGIWVDDTTSNAAGDLRIRGWNGGNISMYDAAQIGCNSIGNYSDWAIKKSSDPTPSYIYSDMEFGGKLTLKGPPSTGAAANAVIATSPAGVFYRSTSSIKYKRDIEDWDPGMKALDLQPRSWASITPMDVDNPDERYVGFIAEEVETTLPELVVYGVDGKADGLSYDRFAAAIIPVLKAQQAQIESLNNRLAELGK